MIRYYQLEMQVPLIRVVGGMGNEINVLSQS